MRYGIAVAAAVIAVFARLLINPFLHEQSRYAFLLPAILLVCIYVGFGPGLTTLIVGSLLTVLFVVPPANSFALTSTSDVGGLVVFLAIGAGVLVLTHREMKERRRREQTELRLEELNAALEQKVADRTAALQQANSELEGFCYSMAHDLRTPTRAIAGNARILLEDFGPDLKPELRVHLGRINGAALKLGTLVDSLLTYARLGTQDLHPATVDLSAISAEIIQSESRRMRVEVETDVQPGLFTIGDERQLRIMLRAIIENSLQYHEADKAPMIRLARTPDGRIEFSDDGIGFDMSYASKVFLPFERLHRDEAFPGVGMGLANVERVVRRHGGQVAIDSKPGQGTKVTISLPLLPDKPTDAVSAHSDEPEPTLT